MAERAELLRRRRCRLLQLAMLFGVLLPLASRTWASLAAALAGEALLAWAWWRECRGSASSEHDGGPPPE